MLHARALEIHFTCHFSLSFYLWTVLYIHIKINHNNWIFQVFVLCIISKNYIVPFSRRKIPISYIHICNSNSQRERVRPHINLWPDLYPFWCVCVPPHFLFVDMQKYSHAHKTCMITILNAKILIFSPHAIKLFIFFLFKFI